MGIYYAKSPRADGKQVTVKEHLEAVAKLAAQFGREVNLESDAKAAAMLHDFGKYSEMFQKVLTKQMQNADHAFPGAVSILSLCKKRASYQRIAEVIAGHHDGLTEFSHLQSNMEECWKSDIPLTTASGKTCTLAGSSALRSAQKAFQNDFPDFSLKITESFLPRTALNLETMLLSRMLFSCLVDADYTASAAEEYSDTLDAEPPALDAEAALQRLYAYQKEIQVKASQQENQNHEVNALRSAVFSQCGDAGEMEPGLFTLTAPTGTGKTLALLHFALRHCLKWRKRRIIIVLPFLTLTEQNAAVYRDIIPELLEDHSQSSLSDQEREYAARWNAPIIVTTSVRFFESLFSRTPTQCRKLHNIADSVVIFDEAQSLPSNLTAATLQAVNALCRDYRCSVLFSTATQPEFGMIPALNGKWTPREILPDHAELYQKLKRTELQWRIDSPTALEQIAEEMSAQASVCAIVNLRKHAQKLYRLLKKQSKPEELYFITTDLCTAHRRELVDKINKRLQNHLPCRVVATQCIEAGVDFDFDVLYRALAPLDSIIQAAGRCNRNGQLKELGSVVVFVPDEEQLYPGDWYEKAAEQVKVLLGRHTIDIHAPAHIREYYELLFHDAKDKSLLVTALSNRSFEKVEKEYHLIENRGVQVIVPYAGELKLYAAIRAEALEKGITPRLLKKAAAITVSVPYGPQRDLLAEKSERAMYRSKKTHRPDPESPSNVYFLNVQNSDLYTPDMGLQLSTPTNHFEPFF